MKVDHVSYWRGPKPKEVQEKFPGEGPFDLTLADVMELAEKFDVAFIHYKAAQPSAKQLRVGAAPKRDETVLALDEYGSRFQQR